MLAGRTDASGINQLGIAQWQASAIDQTIRGQQLDGQLSVTAACNTHCNLFAFEYAQAF
jgi:hypothetical protein